MLPLRMLALSFAAIYVVGTNAMVTDAGIVVATDCFTDIEEQVDEATLNMSLLQMEFKLNKSGVESATLDPYGGVHLPGTHDEFDIDSDMVSLMQHGLKYKSSGGIPVDSGTMDNGISDGLELAHVGGDIDQPHLEELLEAELEAAVSLLQLNVELTPEVGAPSQDYCDEDCILADDQREIAEDWNIQMLQTSVQLAASSMVWPDMPPTETVAIAKKFSDASEDELADAIEDVFSDEYGGVMLFQVDAELEYQSKETSSSLEHEAKLGEISLLQGNFKALQLESPVNFDDANLAKIGNEDSHGAASLLQGKVEIDYSGNVVREDQEPFSQSSLNHLRQTYSVSADRAQAAFDLENDIADQAQTRVSLLQRTIILQKRANNPDDKDLDNFGDADSLDATTFLQEVVEVDPSGHMVRNDAVEEAAEEDSQLATALLQNDVHGGGVSLVDAQSRKKRIAVMAYDGYDYMADPLNGKTEDIVSDEITFLQESAIATADAPRADTRIAVLGRDGIENIADLHEAKTEKAESIDVALLQVSVAAHSEVGAEVVSFDGDVESLQVISFIQSSMVLFTGESDEDLGDVESGIPAFEEKEAWLSEAEIDSNGLAPSFGEMAEVVASAGADFLPKSEVLLEMAEEDDKQGVVDLR